MRNPCARGPNARTERFLKEKLISDPGMFFSSEGQRGAADPCEQDLWCFFRDVRGFERLDAGSLASFTSLRPSPRLISVFYFSLFRMICGLGKLVD